MARQTQIGIEEIQRAKQLRDQATTIAEYRKALSVILAAEHGLDADTPNPPLRGRHLARETRRQTAGQRARYQDRARSFHQG